MFTMRQIALAGFCGVYAGCMPLTVNLARLPYWRGAIIGVFFGALTHLMTTLIYVLIAIMACSIMSDPTLANTSSQIFCGLCIFVIQCLSSIGCLLMGGYFLSPVKKSDPFNRIKLHELLKEKDIKVNPPGAEIIHKSVMHDVVVLLETKPASPDRPFSTWWIVLFGIMSIVSSVLWLRSLSLAAADAIYFSLKIDFYWYLHVVLSFSVPWIVLVVTHLCVLSWLCRDLPTAKKEHKK